MRWDNLFDDLEGQLENELNAEDLDLRAEEERLRLGRLSLRQRLTAVSAGTGSSRVLRIVLVDGRTLTIRPTTFGRDWLAADLLDAGAGEPAGVVPFTAIAAVLLLPEQVAQSLEPESEASARLVDRIGLPFVLRDLCRRRKSLEIQTGLGSVTGTIDRVGRDHLDLAVHAPGTARRAAAVAQYRIIPLGQIQLVRLD
ncbi:hypothetical protein BJQ94_03855 [Cryobacterium sp. SO2]|uniref:hypothetical protein n=1 Tax=Cryobacterium sp. SO2 TaxID=1897060 RepID=UPI00223D8046|nr:hypothetical protein [Cryobacterium sp. SO2]WEO78183.1 hypothetical protein BJQ94_03855 [Cryobacterium sp. SO2]